MAGFHVDKHNELLQLLLPEKLLPPDKQVCVHVLTNHCMDCCFVEDFIGSKRLQNWTWSYQQSPHTSHPVCGPDGVRGQLGIGTILVDVVLCRSVLVTSGVGPRVTIWGLDSASPDLLVATGDVATPTPTQGDPGRTE